jgi:hypothetical protein
LEFWLRVAPPPTVGNKNGRLWRMPVGRIATAIKCDIGALLRGRVSSFNSDVHLSFGGDVLGSLDSVDDNNLGLNHLTFWSSTAICNEYMRRGRLNCGLVAPTVVGQGLRQRRCCFRLDSFGHGKLLWLHGVRQRHCNSVADHSLGRSNIALIGHHAGGRKLGLA